MSVDFSVKGCTSKVNKKNIFRKTSDVWKSVREYFREGGVSLQNEKSQLGCYFIFKKNLNKLDI